MKIQTERLIIRKLSQDDAAALVKIHGNDDVMRFQGDHSVTIESESASINRHIEHYYRQLGYGLYALVLKDKKELIGRAGFLSTQYGTSKVIEISYLLGREFWHQGYAAEAMNAIINESQINEFYAFIQPENLNSIRLASRLGMDFIGETTYKDMDVHAFHKFKGQ